MPKKRLSKEELEASKIRAQAKRNFRRLWCRSDLTLEELADEVSMTETEATAYAESLGLDDRGDPSFFLPTPEEIRLAAAAIRQKWSPSELEARIGGCIPGKLTTGQHNNAFRSQANRRAEGSEAGAQEKRRRRR